MADSNATLNFTAYTGEFSGAIGGFASMTALMDAMNIPYEGSADAYTLYDVEDFTAYLNTDEEVNVRFGPSTDTMRAATLSGVGTPVTVTAEVKVDDTLWYLITCEDAYGTQNGYMMAKFLDGMAPSAEEGEGFDMTVEEDELPVEEEPVCLCYDEAGVTVCAEGCECACHVVEEAACLCYDEAGAMVCAEGCECACHVVEEPELPAEIVEWMASSEVPVTEEMLQRALSAPTLDSMVIEDDEVVYVRTGEVFARIDKNTGYMIDERTGLVIAVVDMENGLIYPIATVAADEE